MWLKEIPAHFSCLKAWGTTLVRHFRAGIHESGKVASTSVTRKHPKDGQRNKR
jgi:hypothetical protein